LIRGKGVEVDVVICLRLKQPTPASDLETLSTASANRFPLIPLKQRQI
jgi:hypothetical protein